MGASKKQVLGLEGASVDEEKQQSASAIILPNPQLASAQDRLELRRQMVSEIVQQGPHNLSPDSLLQRKTRAQRCRILSQWKR